MEHMCRHKGGAACGAGVAYMNHALAKWIKHTERLLQIPQTKCPLCRKGLQGATHVK